jgi:hypothetical protein
VSRSKGEADMVEKNTTKPDTTKVARLGATIAEHLRAHGTWAGGAGARRRAVEWCDGLAYRETSVGRRARLYGLIALAEEWLEICHNGAQPDLLIRASAIASHLDQACNGADAAGPVASVLAIVTQSNGPNWTDEAAEFLCLASLAADPTGDLVRDEIASAPTRQVAA